MHQTLHPIPVATMSPLLRLVLILLLLVAVLAGVLVASNAQIGWLALGFVVVAGPVAVVLDGRSRANAERTERAPLGAWEPA